MPFFDEGITADYLSRMQVLPGTILTISIGNKFNKTELYKEAENICLKGIDSDYLNNSIKKGASIKEPKFDIAVLYENGKPMAFIVVELGECIKFSNVWSVNLICALGSLCGNKSLGQLIMGLYLYTIAKNASISDKRGVLELANGYVNICGLASYSKLGFKYDSTLYGANCFGAYNNLPMIVVIIDPDTVVDIVCARNTGYPKPIICGLSSDFNLQFYLGVMMNLLIFRTLAPNGGNGYIISDYVMKNGTVINYRQLNDWVEATATGAAATGAITVTAAGTTYLTNLIGDIEGKRITAIDPSWPAFFTIIKFINDSIQKAPTKRESKPTVVSAARTTRNLSANLRLQTDQLKSKRLLRSQGGKRSKKTKKSKKSKKSRKTKRSKKTY
jgi:hypothetical protein